MRIGRLLWMVIGLVGVIALSGAASMADTEGYWRFEEAGGTTVVDWGPYGLDGTLNALPLRSTDVAVNPVPSVNLANTRSLDLIRARPAGGSSPCRSPATS